MEFIAAITVSFVGMDPAISCLIGGFFRRDRRNYWRDIHAAFSGKGASTILTASDCRYSLRLRDQSQPWVGRCPAINELSTEYTAAVWLNLLKLGNHLDESIADRRSHFDTAIDGLQGCRIYFASHVSCEVNPGLNKGSEQARREYIQASKFLPDQVNRHYPS